MVVLGLGPNPFFFLSFFFPPFPLLPLLLYNPALPPAAAAAICLGLIEQTTRRCFHMAFKGMLRHPLSVSGLAGTCQEGWGALGPRPPACWWGLCWAAQSFPPLCLFALQFVFSQAPKAALLSSSPCAYVFKGVVYSMCKQMSSQAGTHI